MLWKNRRESSNVEDRRGSGAGRGLVVGGGGCLTFILIIGALLLGIDPRNLVSTLPDEPPSQVQTQNPAGEDEQTKFVKVVLAETEDFWNSELRKLGGRYQEPTLVIFSEAVRSACGVAGASTGPFYCPGDQKVYIDLSFYNELKNQLGAGGDFAQAYVIAHEIGHHIQNLIGTSDKVTALQQRARSEAQANDLSVRLELQADFYAGLWANYAQKKGILEQGDIEEALRAANAIGDDRLQKRAQGYAVPDSFTHGSSEQRMRWFLLGYKSGDIRKGDTFSVRNP